MNEMVVPLCVHVPVCCVLPLQVIFWGLFSKVFPHLFPLIFGGCSISPFSDLPHFPHFLLLGFNHGGVAGPSPCMRPPPDPPPPRVLKDAGAGSATNKCL